MMDQSRLRVAFCNRMLECRQRQLRGHLTGEMPANTATGKRIQNTGQVHKRTAQANIGQIRHPGLISPFQYDPCKHIRIDRKAMARIGGRNHKAFFEMAQQGLFLHNAQHSLVIDSPPFTSQRMGYTPITIASKFQDDLFNPITQRDLFRIVLWLLQVLIVPASTDFKQLTEPLHGKFWMGLMGLCNHEVALRDPMLCSAFFNTWFSRASWPQKRS